MKQNKGFTLIEMLVVVGMIGVLAAAVLTALAPSRNKARDSRVISDLNQLAAIAEVGFDGNEYPVDLAALKALSGGDAVIADIKTITKIDPIYNTDIAKFAVSSALPSGGKYCVDSAGKRKAGVDATGGICP